MPPTATLRRPARASLFVLAALTALVATPARADQPLSPAIPLNTASPPSMAVPVAASDPGLVPLAFQAPPSPAILAERADFKRRKRFIIAGASIFGIGYYLGLLTASVGLSRNNRGSREWSGGLVPLVGPFITAGLRADPNLPRTPGLPFPNSQEEPDYAGSGLMIGIGVTQLIGAGLFFAGLRLPKGRDSNPCQDILYTGDARRPCRSGLQLSVEPIVTPSFAGAGFTGTF